VDEVLEELPNPTCWRRFAGDKKKRTEMAKEGKACNVLLLKINQIDSITEVVEE